MPAPASSASAPTRAGSSSTFRRDRRRRWAGRMWALTSASRDLQLYRIVDRTPHLVANIGAFEKEVNPDEGEIDSNPFDLAKLGGGRCSSRMLRRTLC
jgi:hypothetical protein